MNLKHSTKPTHKLARTVGIAGVTLLCAVSARATLIDNGGGLIYDPDLNITWYDATHPSANWYEAVSWAGGNEAGGHTLWRLPSTSELSHLFYEELLNGGPPLGQNTGPFFNLKFFDEQDRPPIYWSGTEAGDDSASAFDFANGAMVACTKGSENYYAMAVHEGNVGVPDGGLTAILLGAGMLALAGARRLVK